MADRRRRRLHVLDLRRHRAGQLHPRARGRHGRVPPDEPSRTARCRTTSTCTPSPARAAARRRSFTAPGHESRFTFKALNPGLYVYHCATAPVGMHVANGMYGLILVEPPEGLPPVDREFYVMQGDFYTDGQVRREGPAAVRHGRSAIDENPTYVVFNGAVGVAGRRQGAAGEGRRDACASSSATAGRTSSRPSTSSARSSTRSSTRAARASRRTCRPRWSRPAARRSWSSSSRCRAPTSSSITASSAPSTRARSAMLKVEGPENKAIYSGKEVDEIYLGDQRAPNLARRSPRPRSPRRPAR